MASQQTNVVEILIQAKDQASKTIGTLSDSLGTAGAAAQFAQGKITALGGALLTTSVSGIKSLGLLGSAIQSIRSSLDTPVGQTLIQQISLAADEALGKAAKLSTLVKEVSGVSKDFGSGFASRSSSSTIQLFDPSVTGKQLENVVIKTADTFSRSLEQKVRNSDLATAFESKLGVSIDSIASQLDSSLSETLLSGFVGKTLPSALDTALGSVFGVNLTSKIVQSIQAAGKSNLLGGAVGKLAQGSVSGAARELVIGELTPNLEGAQLAGAKLSNVFGKKVAQAVLGERTPASAEFKQIDEQLGGALGDVISRLGQRFPDVLGKSDLPIGKLLATKLRGLAEVTSKNELQAAGNLFVETAFSGLRGIRKDFLGDDLNAVFDLVIAPAFDAQKENLKKLIGIDSDTFSQGFLDPLKKASKNLAKGFDDSLEAGLGALGNGGAIAEYLGDVDEFLGGGITEALSLAGNKAASSFADGFRSAIFEEITGVIDNVDAFVLGNLEQVKQIPQKLTQPVGLVSLVADPLAGATEPLELFELLEAGAGKATNAIFEVSQRLTFLSFGFQALQGFVQNGPFDLLIGQNARLQEQLLATQASLVATNKILQNGVVISDPTAAIKALGPAVEGAIAKIRKDSLELVGVTSKDLVDLFQIVAGQASNIGANLDQSANIVTSTAAALGTLGIPLFQARQEITSIVQGTIDQNSLLAKNLNLNNEMVNKWKAQGTFVDELLKRLEAFRAGNKLASQTISGITSNITELFDEIGRKAGAKFLSPIVKELDNVYQFLAANQETISAQVEQLVSTLFVAFDKIVVLFKSLGDPIAKIFGGIPAYLTGSLVGAITAFSDAIVFTVNVLKPAISVFAEVFKLIAPLGGLFITASIGAKVLSAGILGLGQGFGFLAKLLPGLGELLFLVDKRSNSLFNQFLNLTSVLGNRGAAGFLTFAANLDKIPGAAGFATKQLQGLLGSLAPLSGFLVSLAPQVGGLGIKLAGLAQAFPALKNVFEKAFIGAPGALLVLSRVVGKSEIFGSLAPLIGDASKQLAKFTGIAGNAEKANSLLAKSLQLGGAAAREFAVNSVLLGAGIGIGFIFFDQLILKNKGLQKIIQDLIGTIRKFADTVGAVLGPVFKLIGDTILPLFTFGENSNPFQKIVGGLLIAIAVVKLFGGTITNVFKTVNVSIGTLGTGISETFTKIKRANDSLKEILGLASEEGKSKTFTSPVLEEDPKKRREARSALLKEALAAKKQESLALSSGEAEAARSKKNSLTQVAQSLVTGEAKISIPSAGIITQRDVTQAKLRVSEITKDIIRFSKEARQSATVDPVASSIATARREFAIAQANAVRAGIENQKLIAPLSQLLFEKPTALLFQLGASASEGFRSNLLKAGDAINNFALRGGFALLELENKIRSVPKVFNDIALKGGFALLSLENGLRNIPKSLDTITTKAGFALLSLENGLRNIPKTFDNIALRGGFALLEIEKGLRNIPTAFSGAIASVDQKIKSLFSGGAKRFDFGEALRDLDTRAGNFVDPDRAERLKTLEEIKSFNEKRKALIADAKTIDAGTGLSAEGFTAEKIGKEVQSVDANIQALSAKAEQLDIPVRKAAKGLVNSFKNVIAEIGPTLLLTALFAGITTYIGFIDEQSKIAADGAERLGNTLRESKAKLDILNKSQGRDALGELTKLTAERQRYVDAIKDPKVLNDDPTLKLYDRQIKKLQELRALQAKPVNAEGQIRQETDKEFESFDKKFISFLGGLTGTNVKESTNQVKIASENVNLAQSQAEGRELRSQLREQAALQEGLIKLEQRKNLLQGQGDSDGVAQIEIEIETQKESIAVRKSFLDTVIKGVETNKLDSQSKRDLLEDLKKLKVAYDPANLKIAPIDLPRIGGAIEQAASRYQAAVTALARSAGDPTLFKTKITELLETATALQDAGILRADEVAKNFIGIAANVSADRDQQIKAQQAITEAYQKESQKRIATIDAQQAKIQALLATGKISESEASLLTGKNEIDKIDAQLEAERKAFEARRAIRERTAKDQQEQISRDRLIAEAQVAAATGDPSKIQALRDQQAPILDEKLSKLNQELKAEQAKRDSLDSLNKSGLGTSESVKQFDAASTSISNLEKQISGITEQRGKIDSALKISTGTQKELNDITAQLGGTSKALANARSERDRFQKAVEKPLLKARFLSVDEITSVGKEARKSEFEPPTVEDTDRVVEKRRDAAAKRVAELELQERTQSERKTQLEDIAKKNPEAEARGRATIASLKKAGDDATAFALAQKKEEERKFNEVAQVAAANRAKALAEQELRTLDARIKETLQAEKVGETQRLAQITQLRKSGIKLESEIKLQETAERKRSIALELQLEQQKQKQIEDLEKKGIGVNQETQNANRIKVAELTKTLAEAELAAIEGLVSAVRDRLNLEAQKYAATIEQQNLKLERQKLLFTALEKGLENQSRLSESTNKLAQSTVALRESELNTLNKIFDRQQAAIRKAGGEGNFADLELEEKKLILAEKLAVLKLNSLKEQQKFEAESLERDIQKRDLALERKRVENEIAIERKKVDIAAQDAVIKSAELEVKQRPESEEAKLKLAQARLGQDKNLLELGGLQQEKGFIGDEARVGELVNNNDRRNLAINQEAQTNNAIGDVIGATRDPALQERLQQEQLTRISQNTGQGALTSTDVSNAVALASQPINIRGASFKNPTSALLGQVEQGGFTAAKVDKPENTPFATSFEELAARYPDKSIASSFDDLNKKYPVQVNSFEELNNKFSGKPEPEQPIVSSFDKLTTQINEGFFKVLVAPDIKVRDLTLSLEAEFERVSKKISENPVKLEIDEKRLEQIREEYKKPLAVFDERQLERLEGIVGALGKGEANIANSGIVGAAAGGNLTINAPTTINSQGGGVTDSEVKKAVNDSLDRILKGVGRVTSNVR
jgi:hypothetical protein